MGKPLISVIMPVFNAELYLREAIDSILNQSFNDFELLLINDGSTDASEDIIKSYTDRRIVCVKNESNLGLINTLNIGLARAKGEYIARMDADDISMPERFEKQISFLRAHPEVAVISSRLVMINEDGKETGYWNDDFEATTRNEILVNMPKINCVGHPTVMMRSDVVKSFGYDKKFKNSEDWGLWLTLLSENHIIDKIDEVLLKYRIHNTGTIVNANKENVGKRILRFKRQYLFDKIIHFKFKNTDKNVFRYYLRDGLRYYFPLVYGAMVKWMGTHLKTLFYQRREFKRVFKTFAGNSGALFFFPFSHIGGAEIVHTEIVKAAASKKPIVFFTSHTVNKSLLSKFNQYSQTVEIDQLLIWPFLKKWLLKKIYHLCEQNKNMILFSSNSRFFYELVKDVPEHTKSIDLVHAFMHKHEDSAEKWSLPVINKLSARVIINQRTGKDFEDQYSENNISRDFLKRIVYISNFVNQVEKTNRDHHGLLKIVFVGRGTAEKRVHLLAKIAKEAKLKNYPVEFHFVGNVEYAIPSEYLDACTLHGEVADSGKLNEIYSQSHLLAMASTREGFPMVIMEAMMNGVVPVTTNVGGISQHVEHGKTGVLIDESEPSAFVNVFLAELAKLISDRNKLERMSENAYNYAVTNFNEQQFTNSYLELFQK